MHAPGRMCRAMPASRCRPPRLPLAADGVGVRGRTARAEPPGASGVSALGQEGRLPTRREVAPGLAGPQTPPTVQPAELPCRAVAWRRRTDNPLQRHGWGVVRVASARLLAPRRALP